MKQFAIIFLLGFILFGCVKDDTVTSFIELNEITISGLEQKYSVLLQSRLQIAPEITTTQNDDSNLSYIWYLHKTNAAVSKDTISFERNLDVVMIPQYAVPGVEYTLIYKVIDNISGVYSRIETALEVTTPYTKGTLLLCKENGIPELNFLIYDENRTLVDNVFAKANEGTRIGDNPLNIYAMDPNPLRLYMKKVFVACNNSTGGYYLDPETFEIALPFNEGFEIIPEENPISTLFYKKHGQIEYILMNGKVRKRGTNSGAFNWEIPCVFLEGETDYQVAPFILPYSGRTILYDQKNQRFFKHEPWNKGLLIPMEATEQGKEVFDPNHVGDNLELISWGKETGNVGDFWMLMKNTITQQYKVYKFNITYDFATRKQLFYSKEIIEINESIAPNLYQANSFSSIEAENDILMYSTKNKVYSVNMNQLSSGSSAMVEAEQIDMSVSNFEITKMEYVAVQVPDPTKNDPNQMRNANQIRMSVIDNNLTSLKGGISIYEVSSQGGLHSTHVFTKTGFCDEVIDIEEKYN